MKVGNWISQPQETTGSYTFSGKGYMTKGIVELLDNHEIHAIYQDIQYLVNQHNGIDYILVYIHESTKQKIFCIDQLNTQMIQSGQFKVENNYWTILLAQEYWYQTTTNSIFEFVLFKKIVLNTINPNQLNNS